MSFPHHLCGECKWGEVTPITGVADYKTFFFLKIAAHKVESASLESTLLLASLLSLSVSLSLL